jgi:aryl-alcohol dehydrogenase
VKVSLTLIEELEEPRVNEVRVRIAATGICHTDLYCHSGRGVPIPGPIVLGQEGAGSVEAMGVGVRGLGVGDHVVLSDGSCGVCPSSRAARPIYCREVMKLSFGGRRIDGSSPLSQNGERIAGAFFVQSWAACSASQSAQTRAENEVKRPKHP